MRPLGAVHPQGCFLVPGAVSGEGLWDVEAVPALTVQGNTVSMHEGVLFRWRGCRTREEGKLLSVAKNRPVVSAAEKTQEELFRTEGYSASSERPLEGAVKGSQRTN